MLMNGLVVELRCCSVKSCPCSAEQTLTNIILLTAVYGSELCGVLCSTKTVLLYLYVFRLYRQIQTQNCRFV